MHVQGPREIIIYLFKFHHVLPVLIFEINLYSETRELEQKMSTSVSHMCCLTVVVLHHCMWRVFSHTKENYHQLFPSECSSLHSCLSQLFITLLWSCICEMLYNDNFTLIWSFTAQCIRWQRNWYSERTDSQLCQYKDNFQV